MRVSVNGSDCEFDDGTTIAAMIEAIAGTTRGRAVAVDGDVVPRSVWERYTLRPGQAIQLISAVQGG